MFVDFDAVFHPEEEWKNEIVSDQCPCSGCEEAEKGVDNPYYASDKCICREMVLWRIKALQKLYWLEHGGDGCADRPDKGGSAAVRLPEEKTGGQHGMAGPGDEGKGALKCLKG